MSICSTEPSTSNALILKSDADKFDANLSPKLMLESIRAKAAIGAHFQLYTNYGKKVGVLYISII